jgi:hypothetical protein
MPVEPPVCVKLVRCGAHPLADLFRSIRGKAMTKHTFKRIDGAVKRLFATEQHAVFVQQWRVPIARDS